MQIHGGAIFLTNRLHGRNIVRVDRVERFRVLGVLPHHLVHPGGQVDPSPVGLGLGRVLGEQGARLKHNLEPVHLDPTVVRFNVMGGGLGDRAGLRDHAGRSHGAREG